MIPIRDRNPTTIVPYITYGLIATNALAFLLQLIFDAMGELDAFILNWAMIPQNILQGTGLITMLTSMFLHGGITHIGGNMLYLYIFGNNIEEALGHIRFLIFYLACGVCASSLHIVVTLNPSIPTLGASGAIAGVLGAYLVLYPNAKVDTLVIFYFITWVTLPASVILGFWFVLQLFSGTFSIVAGAATGVAYFAHIGGFAAGALLALPLRGKVRQPPPERPRYTNYRSGWDFY
ncbi:MAG: rhomboid family intramembrane serine protease [Theionarchaea archaeon]|nr:rhomboid family intramembrane serine protease [Theionarchaea archaeon]